MIDEDTLIGYLLGESEREGVELLDDVDAVAVVDAHLAYFDAIGAVGPPAAGDDVTDLGPHLTDRHRPRWAMAPRVTSTSTST